MEPTTTPMTTIQEDDKSTSSSSSRRSFSTTFLSTDSQRAIFYMLLLSLQFAFQPILTRQYTPPNICRSTVVLGQEVLKFWLACLMLCVSGNFATAVEGWTVSSWITVAFVPAALYALQNMAALQAYQHLDALTFNVLNQTKTLSAALCCYLIMGRKQSMIQIVSLFVLLLSALIMEKLVTLQLLFAAPTSISSSSSSFQLPEWGSKHWTHGVAPILVASFISGLSGALSQRNLQAAAAVASSGTDSGTGGGGGGRNPYLFSMELCAASSLILLVSLLVSSDGTKIQQDGFWYGWTATTWIPIVTNSVGGIIVGLVTKYAGSVRKGFALILGMFLSGIVQALAMDQGVSMEQIVGGVLAAVSLWMHATNPHLPSPPLKTSSKPKTE